MRTGAPTGFFHDRYDVPLSRVGDEGWVILAGAFAPLGADHVLRVAAADPEAILLANGGVHSTEEVFFGPTLGILYVGPRRHLTAQAGVLVAGLRVRRNRLGTMSEMVVSMSFPPSMATAILAP